MNRFGTFLTLVLPLLWLAFLSLGFGPVPALGPMLEISKGVWQHKTNQLADQIVPGLKSEVLVAFDKQGVPHIFADSAADLFLAQGFVTASQRLFQLELNGRQTAGRLTEMFGNRALPYDEFFTRFNLRGSARATWDSYSEDPQIKVMVESYVSGVNAWMEVMPDVPPEYKILGV